MSRYIDADELKRNHMFYHEADNRSYAEERDIDETPTVDAVPVTRCMDCKHSTKVEGMIGLVWCDQLAEVGTWVENDWFCADGERRTDGE